MDELNKQFGRALGREDGQGATEYGLVIALVLLTLASTVVVLATSITNFLNGVSGLVDALIP
jgi:Flp pilus assembly pilin Flp